MSSNDSYDGDYNWPKNLYVEMMDMSVMAFFCYKFAFIMDVARKENEKGNSLKGIPTVDSNVTQDSKSEETTKVLQRAYTPSEVKNMIIDNLDILQKYWPSEFKNIEKYYESITAMEDRAKSSGELKPITLEEFDDKYQKKELVYAITKDNVNKRITIVFRGTTPLALASNWKQNLSMAKADVPLPDSLKGKIDAEEVDIHTGFYNYLFRKTVDDTDAEDRTKYDEIVSELKDLLKQYPDHKVYVTGHSLGAALSTVMSFFLCCEEGIPSPVSCINFASPRVGNNNFLAAITYLEKTKKLRMLRSVNENDLITTAPSIGYKHVGWQVTTYNNGWFGRIRKPEIYYSAKKRGFWGSIKKAWGNGFLSNLNLAYDHGGYIKRIKLVEKYLEKEDLNTMYLESDFEQGFKCL